MGTCPIAHRVGETQASLDGYCIYSGRAVSVGFIIVVVE